MCLILFDGNIYFFSHSILQPSLVEGVTDLGKRMRNRWFFLGSVYPKLLYDSVFLLIFCNHEEINIYPLMQE